MIIRRHAVLGLTILLAVALSGCSGAGYRPAASWPVNGTSVGDVGDDDADDNGHSHDETYPDDEHSHDEMADNVIDLATLQPGDEVAGLTVMGFGPVAETRPFNEDNVAISFSGSLTLTGQFSHAGDFGLNPHSIWFGPLEPESYAVLPHLGNQPCSFGFQVSNYEAVKDEFGPPDGRGTATVVIENLVCRRLSQTDVAPSLAEVTAIVAIDFTPPPPPKPSAGS